MKQTMAILANYADSEGSYGLLGPQMAATIIQSNTNFECLVVGIGHSYDKETVKKSILQLNPNARQVIGFSNLGGRPELYRLAKELKAEGAITILGGPQADVDYIGEVGWEHHRHRFSGLRDCFSFAVHGPAEQLIPFLNSYDSTLDDVHGMLCVRGGECRVNAQDPWDKSFLKRVDWRNLYKVGPSGLERVSVAGAQVVQQIGCPYAARVRHVAIDYPTSLAGVPFEREGSVFLDLSGCSFCDVARDKQFGCVLPLDNVLAQIMNLPDDSAGVKIPFELISEMPLPSLPRLFSAIEQRGIRISQVNLVTRSDWLLTYEEELRDALMSARSMNVRVLASEVGFESFAARILRNLNKGYPPDTNLAAVALMRQLKAEFPESWFYSTRDGASHGFIHPTPWDSVETEGEMNTLISVHGLDRDLLPNVSVPLIIHHACGLGDWVREVERREGVKLNRMGSVIEWW